MELEYPRLQFADAFWWRRVEEGCLRLGITREAAEQLTYVTQVELPAVGAHFRGQLHLRNVESQKVVSDLIAPVSGTVLAQNAALREQPFLVNSDPEGAGWLLVVRPA